MTAEEAIKALNLFVATKTTQRPVFADVAINALEKQIPKKPLYEQFWLCPECKAEIYWDTDYGQQHFNYCTDCGQAIDWSDEDGI